MPAGGVSVPGGLETERLLERVNQLYYDRLFQDRKSQLEQHQQRQQEEEQQEQTQNILQSHNASVPASASRNRPMMTKSSAVESDETKRSPATGNDVIDDEHALQSNSSFEDIRYVISADMIAA